MRRLRTVLTGCIFFGSGIAFLFSQTTGKIAGRLVDKATGEPLVGANVMVLATRLGAAADASGNYFIINVPPGTYTVQASMMGFSTVRMQNVRVSVNSTVNLKFEMDKTALQGEAVVVTASAISYKKDQTSSVRNVSAEQMARLPVENMDQVVNMQAGVVRGHFRGGRDTEVAYMVDGLSVVNSFNGGSNRSVSVEKEVIEDLEVIKGTFDAEYGKAMSGIVNAVIKDGADTWHGFASGGYNNFLTSHNDVFIGLGTGDAFQRNLSQDYKAQIEGPIFKNKLNVLVNARFQNNRGPFNGIRRFQPRDYSEYVSANPFAWHVEHTGDNAYVAMDRSQLNTVLGKLTFKSGSSLKVSALFSFNDGQGRGYNHYYKYNPDGLGDWYNRSYFGDLDVNHMISRSLFYDLKISHNLEVGQSYKYEDPIDSRYLHPNYAGDGATGFATGGTAAPGKSKDTFLKTDVKFDIYWQANKTHGLKAGMLATAHTVDRTRVDVRNKYEGLTIADQMVVDPETGKIDFPFYVLEPVPITKNTINIYRVKPTEWSGYFQDKMEFDEMVIKLGARYDYFNTRFHYPSNRRNPSNQLLLPDSMMSTFPMAKPQVQLSPRLGLSYKLSDQAVLRFSYGHFFMMPRMYAMYENNIFRVLTGQYETTMGNTQLKAEKTVQYEIGLWQQLMQGMGLDVTLYYRDIYNLLSTSVVTTYNQIRYGLYTNKDYGNARGIEVTWDYNRGVFFSNVNFTVQYTRGNADNPLETFTRAGDSMDPIKRLIPMPWDQRFTLNATAGASVGRFNAALTGYFNSGTPYTYTPLSYSPLSLINLYPNNATQPSTFSVDLSASYNLPLRGRHSIRFQLNVYNLLDRLNANWVYGTTGQPYTRIVTTSELAGHRSDFNDFYDRVEDPSMYAWPRAVKLTVGYNF
jgi:outer membrane receptor protein involved in Fe transport